MQNSGKPEFCWHPSKESASFKAMDCRVKPGNDGLAFAGVSPAWG